MKPQLALRDLLWLVLVCGLALGWWVHARRLQGELVQQTTAHKLVRDQLGNDISKLQDEVRGLQAAAGIVPATAEEKQRASKAAAALLQNEGLAWGDHIRVTSQKWNTLVLEYATPPGEQDLLGERAVRVYRDDWVAAIVKRE
jgi:hypothetical protein